MYYDRVDRLAHTQRDENVILLTDRRTIGGVVCFIYINSRVGVSKLTDRGSPLSHHCARHHHFYIAATLTALLIAFCVR